MRTVKVCGMTQAENVAAVAELPVQYLGFIFYAISPRAVPADLADWLSEHREVLASVKRVGVFVNAEVDEVLNAVHDFELDYVQLHGTENPEYCALLQQLWRGTSARQAGIIKAFPVDESFDFATTEAYALYCDYFLFDTKTPQYGGSGRQFDWSVLSRYAGSTPFWLSGGLGLRDAEPIKKLDHPRLAGYDLNSRFELEPGLKDVELLRSFLAELS